MKGRTTIWFRRAAVVLAFLCLIWLLTKIGWARIYTHLRMIGGTGLLILFAVGALEATFDALALQFATLRRARFWHVLFSNQAGSLVNSVTPSDAGEILKISLLAQQTPEKAASAIVVWNVTFRLTKSIVLGSSALFACLMLPARRGDAILFMGLSGITLATYFIANFAIRRGWVGRLTTRLTRFRILQRPRWTRFATRVTEVERSAALFRHEHPRYYYAIVALQIAARSTDVVAAWLILQLLHSHYSFALCVLIYTGLQLIGLILPPLPAKIGVAEGSAYLLFSYLGLDAGLGVVFRLIIRIKQLLISSTSLLIFPLSERPFFKLTKGTKILTPCPSEIRQE